MSLYLLDFFKATHAYIFMKTFTDHDFSIIFLHNMRAICNMRTALCDMGVLCDMRTVLCYVGAL